MKSIQCPYCKNEVPPGALCNECGRALEKKKYYFGTTRLLILQTIHDNGDSMLVKNILITLNEKGKPRESVRTILSNMVKLGLLTSPKRGRYTITPSGIECLQYMEENKSYHP